LCTTCTSLAYRPSNMELHGQTHTISSNKIIIIIINDIFIAQLATSKVQQMRYWQLNRCVFSCFLKTPRVMSGGRSQFSRQTVPNYRAVYSKATTTINCPSTRHNELACCRGSHVGTSSLSRDRCAVWCRGMVEPCHENTCIPVRPFWTWSFAILVARYLIAADSMCLSLFTFTQRAPEKAEELTGMSLRSDMSLRTR